MTLVRTSENEAAKFNLYFLAYPGDESTPTTNPDGGSGTAHKEGLLELTWNYGTEKDPNFKYHNGNDEPQGFGHLCMHIPIIFCGTTALITFDRYFRGRLGRSLPAI